MMLHSPPSGLLLTSDQWRCLRVLSEVGDIAHAARRLHWSQVTVRAALAELNRRVGADHITLAGNRIQLSPSLKNLLGQRSICERPRARSALEGQSAG